MLAFILLANSLFTPRDAIALIFADSAPLITKIALCESGLRQYDSHGNVVVSKTNDHGLMQINALHKKAALKIGMDIDTPDGNLLYANYLYQTEGTKPWDSSRPCWAKSPSAATPSS